MAHNKRYFLPGETYFISQQGQGGNLCFFDDACFEHYLTRIVNCLKVYQVQLHSFALLPNEIYLLMTPSTPTGISSLLKAVGNAYVQYYNNRFERSGILWKGPFNSCLIPNSGSVVECQKYIELAPVRARLVSRPGEYRWSTYCINAFGGHGIRVTMHDQYKEFGARSSNRFRQYRDYVNCPVNRDQLRLMEHRLHYGYPPLPVQHGVRSVRVIRKFRYSPPSPVRSAGMAISV